ncbi:MAG: hypothetical protein LIO62_03425, partial [Clostridiales bacterium]|nr:hypothetical protein [Clostridiales bacterium]
GAYLLGGNNTGKVIFYFLYSKILLIIGLIFFMTVGLNGLFSKMLTKKLSNNDPAIMRRYETNNSDKIFAVKSLQKFSKPVKIIISCILLFVSIIAASIIAEDNIGFYDSYVKFYSADTLSVCSVDYEDMKIVRVLGYYDDETDDYIEYTDVESYIVAGSDGSDYYVIENILPNGSTDKYIKDLAYKYSIEIDECKSAEDYSESLEFVGEN